jgi:hypothetical protein
MTVSGAASPLRAVDGRVPGRRGLATRQKLLECTGKLLDTTPYRDLKVTDITRAAGTSLIAERPWRGGRGVTSAEELVDGFLSFWREHRPILRVVDLLSTEGDRRFRRLRVEMLNAMTKALAEEIATLDGDSGVDPMAMAGALVGLLAQTAGHQHGFEAWDIPFGEVRQAMIRLVYWGVTGPKLPRR